jgi:C4-dicarboxylate-specific signal transduction histidine kinase
VFRWLLEFRRDVLAPISRWHLYLGLAAWLAVTAAGWALGHEYIGQFRAQREQAVLARASVAAEALEQTLLRSLEAVQGIHSLTQTRETLLANGDTAGAAAIADHLRSLSEKETFGVLQVSVIGADGWMTWSTTPVTEPVWLGDREHFLVHKAGRRDLFISAPLIGRASKRWSVQLTVPLLHRDGSFAGVSVVSFDPLRLSATLADLSFGVGGVSAVLRLPDGNLIARNQDAEQQMARPANSRHPVVLAAQRAPTGTMRFASAVDGRQFLVAYRVVGTLPLVVAVGLDMQVELADVRSLAASVHALTIAAGLLALAMLTMTAQRATRQRARRELEQTRSQAAAAEMARRQTAELLSGLPAAVYRARLSPAGEVCDFELTENARRLTGWNMAHLAARSDWTDRVSDLDRAAWQSHFRTVMRRGEATVEYRFPRPNGTQLWLRDQARVFQKRGQGEVLIVGYISDITSERELQAQAVASAKLATLGEMATGLAHELNQPIAIMSLAAENSVQALRRKGSDGIDFALQRLQRISDQCRRARTIVDHLRIFGRSDEGQLGPVALQSVVDGVLTLVASAVRAAGIELEVALPPDLPDVLARAVLAEQVVVNLVLNARDAMEGNGDDRPRRLRISAQAELDAGTVSLAVTDSGPGIAAAVADRLFEPFFTTKEIGKGTGLGLSICHGIMRSFGGNIIARNGPDPGASFIVMFRVAPAAGAGDQPAAAQPVMPEEQPA